MYFAYAAPHEKMAWEARTEPAIIEVFEKLWETKELISSFDGMNISMPRRKDLNWSPWPHCDQNQNRKGYFCQYIRFESVSNKSQDASRARPSELCAQWPQ